MSMSFWIDISTAPEDQPVLVWVRKHRWQIARQLSDGQWMSDSNDMLDEPPTHWMPLPAPPER
jgi:hypothetical protein